MKRWMRGTTMTAREYEANLNGIHMLFGAMLGVVLANTESLSTFRYVMTIAFTVGIEGGGEGTTGQNHLAF